MKRLGITDVTFDDEVSSILIFGDLFMKSIIENNQLCCANVWFLCSCCTASRLVL